MHIIISTISLDIPVSRSDSGKMYLLGYTPHLLVHLSLQLQAASLHLMYERATTS